MNSIISPENVVVVAAGIGVLHTLLGPDHYLPLVGMAQERRFSRRKLAAATLLFGVVHVGSAALLALVCAKFTPALVEIVASADRARAVFCGVMLMAFGIGLLRRRATRTDSSSSRASTTVLGALAILGPCEWMWPAVSASHGAIGASIAAFSFATIATMFAAVFFLSAVGGKIASKSGGHRARQFAAASYLLSGLAMIALG